MPPVPDEVHVNGKWKASHFVKCPPFVDGKFCSIMLLPNTLENFMYVFYGYFSFLTFKQDIPFMWWYLYEKLSPFYFFYPWWMVVEDAVNHVFINGFNYEHHIIVRKKAREWVIVTMKLMVRWKFLRLWGTNTGGFLMHSNSGSNEPFIRLRWITRQWWGENCVAIHKRVELMVSGLPNLVHDSFHCANFSRFLSKHKNGHLLLWKQM